ncbi:MAG: 4Fe-4S binding protein [Ignavibacteria bacterium]|jgi:NAD-dependent dihydropyrimidine dehydrogenase PreA subunit
MKLKKTNTVRIAFQSVILALIGYVALRPLFDSAYVADFEAYCPFGGISSLGSKIDQGTMSCQMSETQVLLGIGLIIGVIIFGKLFCSYVCPVGTVTEWIGKLGKKLKIRIDLPLFLDKPLRILKYALLFITLYFTVTSSELFCKEFDPYFASVNLFNNSDIALYFAIPAFVITILGSLFFRQFWCRYLCPLGAISNVFLNVVAAGGLIIIYVAAVALGAEISLIWLILGLVIVGLVNELGLFKSFFLPVVKITRNTDKCTNCGLCDLKCPQGIKISDTEKVDHIDCNLCTDCVYSCPTENVLTINKSSRLKYLSPIAVAVLIFLSLGASTEVEFTTISERWGNFNKLDKVAVYEQTDLKNVKCYGSAKSLQGQLEAVHGIYGLDAYASSHTVKVYYSPEQITETDVKKSLFTPRKQEVRIIKGNSIDYLSVWEIGILGLFDIVDNNNLFYLFREDEGIYGFETHFGEPVKTVIFYDESKTGPDEILKLLEKESVIAKKAKGEEEIELNFEAEGEGENKGTLSVVDYKRRIFRTYDRKFNGYDEYGEDQLSVYCFPMPEAGKPAYRRYFGSLTSHLSADEAIVRFSTRYIDEPYGYIFFDPTATTVEKIKEALTKPVLTVFISDNKTKNMKNPFHIKPEGKIQKMANLQLDTGE